MKRIIPGILLAAGWLLLLLEGSFLLFWAVVLLIGLIGGREYCRMAFPHELYEIDRIVLAGVISLPIVAAVYARHELFSCSFGLFVALAGIIAFTIYHYGRLEEPLRLLSRGVLGVLYVGFLAAHLVMIRGLADGVYWLVILTGITAGSDTCAYFIGSRWGRRKLCPRISPNKTVEGALGGIAGGVAAALLLSQFFTIQAAPALILVLALGLSVVSMTGDLLESIIKRGTGAKDSGTLLGGHGGVLDRVDSLLFAAPVLYYTLLYAGF